MANPYDVRSETRLVGSLEPSEAPTPVDPETPFRILVLGNFRGRDPGDAPRTQFDRPRMVDRDNFDEVLASLGVEARLRLGGDTGATVVLRFESLDDFHPDRILATAPVFQQLRTLREELDHPATFERAAAELTGKTRAETSPTPPPVGEAPPLPTSPEALLDAILGQQVSEPAPATREPDDWRGFLAGLTANHVVPRPDPRRGELQEALDAAAGDLMRSILHHPTFQALESTWRGLFFLTRRLETGTHLKVYAADVTEAELSHDLSGDTDLRSTAAYRAWIKPNAEAGDEPPWAVLAASFRFGPVHDDVSLLARMAGLARLAGAPLLAGADPRFLGCTSLRENPDPRDWRTPPDPPDSAAWDSLRRHPDAPFLGLALPRFLLRLPYGSEADPVETFVFEERDASTGHEGYLWGNPAFALAEMLGRNFTRHGWELRPGLVSTVENLPLFAEPDGEGDFRLVPCAEVNLTDRAAGTVLEGGLMPILSEKGRGTIRVARFQSVAEPPCALAGRW